MKFFGLVVLALCIAMAFADGKWGYASANKKETYGYNSYPQHSSGYRSETVYVQNTNRNANDNKEKTLLENESANSDININSLLEILMKMRDEYEPY
ncbi:unnamed protein product [Brachionus calyciflorus]|uniref:Uncharacterized protein n=1 Tax=Brachionus calyciflorus TaxID=104777 RepID=A0A814DPP3_9BILA|nr:unnamed protein product [Brachionus calyciflorus]